jgi:hypothetical protein
MKRRTFIRNTTVISVGFSGLLGTLNLFETEDKLLKGSKLKDNFWLWGQTAGSHHENNAFSLPGVNRMGPREGCNFFDIEKCCRVSMGSFGPVPPFNEEAEKIKDLKEVVWSAIGADGRHQNDKSDIEEVLRMADIYPNVSGAVLDDFFGAKPAKHSISSVRSMADKLHNFSKRRLDLWVVWYTSELDFKVNDYLELFDVITLWTWKGSDLINLDSNIQKFIEKTPGKRHMLGCYMWNYGEKKPLTIDQMKYQLDRCYYWLNKKKIAGLVFCSNCIADIGLDAVEYTRKWISEVGKEKL